MHNKLEIFTAHPILPRGKLTYFPAGNEINLTFIYCNNSFVVKRLLKYLISQVIIHGIKLCIVRKTTHTHIPVHTYTLYVLPVTQIRGRVVILIPIPQEWYWVLDIWTLPNQLTPKDIWFSNAFYKLGFEVCQLNRRSLGALDIGRRWTPCYIKEACDLVL